MSRSFWYAFIPKLHRRIEPTTEPTAMMPKVLRSMRTRPIMLTETRPTMRAVPRSGWAMMSPSGSPMSAPGTTRSRSVHLSPRLSRWMYRATASIRLSFTNSLGWKRKLPIGIQRRVLRMLSPTRNTNTSAMIDAA